MIANIHNTKKTNYTYDTWDNEGCGHDDYNYLTYIDDVKMTKSTLKETEVLIQKLRDLGMTVEFSAV